VGSRGKLGDRPPAPGPVGFVLPQRHKGAAQGAWGISLPWTRRCRTSPFPADTWCLLAAMLGGQWVLGRGDSRLPGGDRPPAWPGHPISAPGLARSGFIWCKALSHENKVIELVLGQVLHFSSGKLSVLCEPRPFPGWPRALQPCSMLHTHHLHP